MTFQISTCKFANFDKSPATSMSLEDKMKIIEEQAHIIFEFYVAFHWVLNFDNPSLASKECSVVEYSPSK